MFCQNFIILYISIQMYDPCDIFTSYLHLDDNNDIKLEIKNVAATNAFFYQFEVQKMTLIFSWIHFACLVFPLRETPI